MKSEAKDQNFLKHEVLCEILKNISFFKGNFDVKNINVQDAEIDTEIKNIEVLSALQEPQLKFTTYKELGEVQLKHIIQTD